VSLAIVLALALGIGGNAALFGIVEALELRPLPVRDPERLVTIGLRSRVRADQLPGPLSVPDAEEIARSSPHLGSLALYRRETFGWSRGAENRRVAVLLASAGLFRTLGLPLQLGRELAPSEVGPSPGRVAVISDRFWRHALGGSASVLGSTLTLDGDVYQVVGVAAPEAEFPLSETPADVILPLGVTPFTQINMQHQGADIVRAVGRLAPGATIAEARAEVRGTFDRIIETHPSSAPVTADVVPLRASVLGGSEQLPLLLLGATGCVLLIACVNVANLLLARAVRRRRELAIRAALGASRGQLRRQLLVESLLLSTLAAGAAVLICVAVLSGSVPLGPRAGSVVAAYRVDAGVVAFAALLALVCGIACGLLAGAFALPGEGQDSLQASAAGGDPLRHEQVRSTLVVVEVAVSVVLLVGAGLLGRTLFHLASVDPGMRIQGLVAQELAVPDSTPDPRMRQLLTTALERVSAIPGVEAAGAIWPSPFGSRTMTTAARTSDLGDLWPETVDFRLVAPGTFRVLAVPVLVGREFETTDGPDRPPVIVVNEALARRLWPDQDPIGKQLAVGLQDHELRTVVGVVGNVRQSLETPARPEAYVSMLQAGPGRACPRHRPTPARVPGAEPAGPRFAAPRLQPGALQHPGPRRAQAAAARGRRVSRVRWRRGVPRGAGDRRGALAAGDPAQPRAGHPDGARGAGQGRGGAGPRPRAAAGRARARPGGRGHARGRPGAAEIPVRRGHARRVELCRRDGDAAHRRRRRELVARAPGEPRGSGRGDARRVASGAHRAWSAAFTAASGFTSPHPCRSSSMPGTRCAVSIRMRFTSPGERAGLASSIWATIEVTIGAAKLVPSTFL
jgi:predicted permease